MALSQQLLMNTRDHESQADKIPALCGIIQGGKFDIDSSEIITESNTAISEMKKPRSRG